MDSATTHSRLNHPLGMWIISLAICVVFCAFIFVVFAAYLLDVRKTSYIMEIRLETIDNRLAGLTNDVNDMRHNAMVRVAPEAPSVTTTGGVTVIRGQMPAAASVVAPVEVPAAPAPVKDALPIIEAPAMTPPADPAPVAPAPATPTP